MTAVLAMTSARSADPQSLGLGACIDCGLCVQVCPTGIDIRDGIQLPCIGCGLCIDACTAVMTKIKRPTGKPVGRFCLSQRPGSTSSAKLPISRS